MPEDTEQLESALDAVADELYGVPPDEFVGARDAAVKQARERGDRELAKAIGRLRRPTKAAWLANLLARHRTAQLDGLLGLAAGLADAQRSLDGAALRQLSSKRHQLVAAMAREAGRLAQEAGDPAAESVLRELQGILDAALARPEIAEQVRSGRLTRTLSYTGFGPESDPDAVPAPAAPAAPPAEEEAPAPPADDEAERERLRAERNRRAEALAAAEDEEAQARAQADADESAREDAATAREDARRRVAELQAELEAAREEERAAAAAAREAETAAKASARAVGVAASRTARARARLEELDER
ncbi:hypothetical protein [Pseudonocardia zijingensis]|uniref:hypothetical protein n=1 Tax=Pseudonocardia zijingensis TaxID=153376 RepID=UPI0036174BCB